MIALGIAASALGLAACEEDDKDICEIYCDAERVCQEQSGQMFSYHQCREDCVENVQRHQSVGCEERLVEYLECLIDLPCSEWSSFTERCAYEIDYLDSCVDGNY
jgi:hypothetical protein